MAIFNILRSKSSYRSLFSGKLVGSYMKSHRQSDLSLHCGTARECIRHQSVAQSFINSGKVVGSYMKSHRQSDLSLHCRTARECICHQSVAQPVLNLEKDYLRDRSLSFMKSGLAIHYGTMSSCIPHHSLAKPVLNFEKVFLMDKSLPVMKSNLVHYGTLRSIRPIRPQSFAKFFWYQRLLHFSTKRGSCSDTEFSVYELEFDNGTLTIAIVGLDYFIFLSDGLGFGKDHIIERYRRKKIICIGGKVVMMRSGYNRFPMHIQSYLEKDVRIFGDNLNSESCAYIARCYMNEVWWGNPELEDRVYKFRLFFGCFEFGRPRIFLYNGRDDSIEECSTFIRGNGKDEVQKVIKLHLLNGINYTPSEAVVQSLRQSVVYACLHAYPPVGGNILLMEARKGKITTLFNASFERLDGTCALLVKIGLLTPDDYFPCTPFRKRKI